MPYCYDGRVDGSDGLGGINHKDPYNNPSYPPPHLRSPFGPIVPSHSPRPNNVNSSGPTSNGRKLLLPQTPRDSGKPTLVLDLDETLVHSSFRSVPSSDFVIPVTIDGQTHHVYVMKRPGVDEFLRRAADRYEVVVYTASLNKYADPLLDLLDVDGVISARLFRESCVCWEGNYVKDLGVLDRDLRRTIIIDNSPTSYVFHPENAIDCSSFIDDPMDRELDVILGFLLSIGGINDFRGKVQKWKEWRG